MHRAVIAKVTMITTIAKVTMTATIALLACASAAAAAVRISPSDGDSHSYPTVCRGAEGFVAAWETSGAVGREIRIQRLDEGGRPEGAMATANRETAGDQQLPDIACRADGSFMVVWESRGQDGSGLGIFGRYFDPSGSAVGDEFQINTHTNDDQRGPRVCFRPGGEAIVVWASMDQDGDGSGIFGQLFAADSTASGVEFQVNASGAGSQIEPAVACGSDGGSLIVWAGPQDGMPAIVARRLGGDGALDEREWPIRIGDTGTPHHPSVAFDPRGHYTIAFETAQADLALATLEVAADGGSNLGPSLRPALGLPRRNEAPAIAVDADANIAIAWSQGTGFDFDVAGLRSTSLFDGERLTTLSRNRAGNDGALSTLGRGVAIATAPDGDLVVWQKRDVFADDSSSAIFAQRFRDCAGDCSGDASVTVDELVRAVRIALGQEPLEVCRSVDGDGDGSVAVNELIRAVNEALASICPAPLG